MLPMIEVNGKQISGLQDIISYLSGELLGRPLTFIEKETVNLIEIKLNSKLVTTLPLTACYLDGRYVCGTDI